MKISRLKTMTIPKIAVLATALAVGLAVATVDMRPAQATPDQGLTCIGCHTAGGSVAATPSTATPAGGAAFTVAIVITNAVTGNSGYNVSLAGASVAMAGPAAGKTFTANLTAPAAAGTYLYTVGANTGPFGAGSAASTTTFSIVVAATGTTTPPVTTPPVTTTPPPATTTTGTVAPSATTTAAVVPAGAPATGAGGAQSGNGPLVGLGGLALLLSGAAMVTVIRRRRQV